MKAVVVGGTGVMGQFFAELLREKYEILISSRDEDKGRSIAAELGAEYTPDRDKAIREADIVLLSTPIKDTPELIKKIAPMMKANSLLMDVSSLKTHVEKAFSECSTTGVEFISLHPMFCPPTEAEGQNIILVPIKGVRWLPVVKELFKSKGFNIHESTVEKHDKIMALIQVIPHISFMGIAATIKEMGMDSRELKPYMGKFHKIIFDFIPRVTAQNPEMYASIQSMNPNSPEVARTLTEKIKQFQEYIDKKETDKIINELRELGEVFPDNKEAIKRSNKLIDLYRE